MSTSANARLWSSLAEGDEKGVVQALEEGADVNQVSPGGGRPIHSAALRNSGGLVRILLNHGALCDASDDEGFTPLMVASLNGHTEVVQELLKGGADPKIHRPDDFGGDTALHMVTNTDEGEVLRTLLEAGADPNARASGMNNMTPLHFAAEIGRKNLAELLANHPSCEVNLRDARGLTPARLAKESCPSLSLYLDLCCGAKSRMDKLLIAAVRRNDAAEVRTALDKEADLSLQGPEDGGTLLHLASQGSSGQVLQMLLSRGASVDARTSQGFTPLMIAAQRGATEALGLLLAHRANPKLSTPNGTTALHLAVQSQDSSAVTALLDAGVDVNATKADGSTPLHIAAALGALGLAHLLLGDYLCCIAIEGRSPAQVAREAGHLEFAKFIEQRIGICDESDDESAQLPREDFRVVVGQPVPPGPGVYRNLSEPYRGRVLIINYREFSLRIATRHDSERDVANLRKMFRNMGYQVEDHQDLDLEATKEVLNNFRSNENLAKVDSMFVCMLSHGIDRDTFYTSDMRKMDVPAVRNMFKDQACPLMKGKPKVFLFNFCRGKTLESFSGHSIGDDIPCTSQSAVGRDKVPPAKDEAPRDMLTLYASTEGFKAFRTNEGTLFVRSLCQTLAAHAHNTDMVSMVQKLDQLMTARRHATTPEAQSFAFKKFFLNPLKPSDA
ncbi:ankyrin-1-like isoform X2 [Penaeus chinensis]|uniref:ankyrin-1-like isoform X2 n=1 Tax=Penaeus chinensis TaxID=139456 RepID=UPI001FB5E604|nr:ankyrin-1-like isoform X2 [Penaeus chinensis]